MSETVMAEAAHRWLMNSGIRASFPAAGAFRREFDVRRRHYAAHYPEVTAYALQLHLRRAREPDDIDMKAAIESGDWLCAVQAKAPAEIAGAFSHALRDGVAEGGWYSFDTSIACHALLDLAAATGRDEYRAAALSAGEWLLGMQRDDGSFEAARAAPPLVKWAGSSGCLHAKHALALASLYKSTGEPRFADAGRRLLDWVISLQSENGRIDAVPGADYAILHTQCYAIEGLLGGALLFEHPRALAAAVKGARFIASVQSPAGAVPRYAGEGAIVYLREIGSRWPALRQRVVPADVGATAQAVRVWTWVQQVSGDDYESAISRALAWLTSQQLSSDDPTVNGGMPAGIDQLFGLRHCDMRLYPWVSVFVIDAVRIQQVGQRGVPDLF